MQASVRGSLEFLASQTECRREMASGGTVFIQNRQTKIFGFPMHLSHGHKQVAQEICGPQDGVAWPSKDRLTHNFKLKKLTTHQNSSAFQLFLKNPLLWQHQAAWLALLNEEGTFQSPRQAPFPSLCGWLGPVNRFSQFKGITSNTLRYSGRVSPLFIEPDSLYTDLKEKPSRERKNQNKDGDKAICHLA